jgi:mannose-6-phosphate isomerase-like protein (cupin superfamily)
MTDLTAAALLERQRRRFGLSIEDCWAAYFALGGHSEVESLRAFLHGDRALPQTEIDILAGAIGDLAPASQSALWLETIPASEGAGPATGSTISSASDGIIQLIAEQRHKDPDADGAPREPVRLIDVELLIRAGPTTTVRTALPASADTDLPRPLPPGGSLLRVDNATTPDWEIHASGDELLVLLAGEARIEIDRSISTTATLRVPYEAYVIPRGRWHRHLAASPDTKLIFLTPTEPPN